MNERGAGMKKNEKRAECKRISGVLPAMARLAAVLVVAVLFAGCVGEQVGQTGQTGDFLGNQAERPTVMRIDFENHFKSESFFAVLSERGVPPYYRAETGSITWAEGQTDPIDKLKPALMNMGEDRLRSMDEAGIDVAVISASVGVELLDPAESIEVARQSNDAIHELTQKYPGRFLGVAILPVKDVEAAVAELERCVTELGFVGWQVHSNFGGFAELDDEMFRPIFRKAAELGVYVYLHPGTPLDARLQGYGYPLYGAAFGYTVDTAVTTLRLIYSGLFDEFPELTMILGHLGETFPFLMERIDNRAYIFGTELLKNKEIPSYYFRNNILVTTSGNASEAALNCTIEVFGIDRILFATDHPFENAVEAVAFLDNLPLSDEARASIFYRNAVEKLNMPLFGRTQPPIPAQ